MYIILRVIDENVLLILLLCLISFSQSILAEEEQDTILKINVNVQYMG